MTRKKVLCLINARGGSKRIKNKNIILFNSKPLIYWTIKSAQESKIYNDVFVNTDSIRIAKIASSFGAKIPFLRPKYLAEDTTSSVDSTLYFLNKLNESADSFNLLQPTSPLRTKKNILSFHNFIEKNGFKSVVSISKLHNFSSNRYKLLKDFSIKEISKKYHSKKNDLFYLNGSMYYNDINSFLRYKKFIFRYTKGFKMSKKNSIDIDTNKDLDIAIKNI